MNVFPLSLSRVRKLSLSAPILTKRFIFADGQIGKKTLIPLIKHLHPDLLAQYSKEVQNQNKKCIQNLNDLWDTIESTASHSPVGAFTSRALFRQEYDLTCYLLKPRATLNEMQKESLVTEKGEVFKTVCLIKIPPRLCTHQQPQQGPLTHELVREDLCLVLGQLTKLLDVANIKHSWTELLHREKQRRQSRLRRAGGIVNRSSASASAVNVMGAKEEARYRSSPEFGELERYMFDRWVAKNMGGNQSAAAGRGPSELFNPSRSHQHQRQHRRLGESEGAGATRTTSSTNALLFQEDIDMYLRSGNVQVSSLSMSSSGGDLNQNRSSPPCPSHYQRSRVGRRRGRRLSKLTNSFRKKVPVIDGHHNHYFNITSSNRQQQQQQQQQHPQEQEEEQRQEQERQPVFLTPLEELQAVTRLRHFLLEYADVLDFSFDRWQGVVIVLYAYAGTDAYPLKQKKRSQQEQQQQRHKHEKEEMEGSIAPAAAAAAESNPDTDSTTCTTSIGGGYVVVQQKQQNLLARQHCIVKIPHDFKNRHLLDFLGEHVAAAKLQLR
mmetsp:Transcript_18014/g.30283  ORF Transcript_18014/g.30283 Transcript_18014/m.30283 type:complete len:551 (+) Transcript_18014:105-1757(+)